MIKKAVFILAVAVLLTAPAMAQEGSPATPAAPTYNTDSKPSPEVAPGYYGKMLSPVLSKFNLSIGGYIKLDYTYNSSSYGNNIPAMENIQQAPRVGTDAYKQDQSLLTARQSRFWFRVGGPTFLGAKTNALIEADFYGGTSISNESSLIRMRQAWGTIDWTNTQILFGQAYDIFGPAVASTIDFGSGASIGTPNNPRVAQIRLTQKVNFGANNSLKFVVGVQNPTQDGVTDFAGYSSNYGGMVNVAGQVMFISKVLGVAPGYYGQSMNNLTVGAFGLYGNSRMFHKDVIDEYGYGLYAFVPVLKSKDGKSRAMTMSLESQGYIATGMKWNYATAGDFEDTSPGQEPTGAWGYGVYGQLIFYPIQDLGITAGYGRRQASHYASYPDSTTTGSGASAVTSTGINERFNEDVYVNLAYDLNAAIRVAAEYEHLRTQWDGNLVQNEVTKGSDWGQANVMHLAVYYFF